MADVISAIPGSAARYRYEDYFDGQLWELEPGVDCPMSLRSAATSIRLAARRRKVKVTVSQSSRTNRIYVQAVLTKAQKEYIRKEDRRRDAKRIRS